METINDRFIQVMEYYNHTPSKFADELGVIRSSISHIISGRNKPGLELIQKLLTTFPEIDADWLLLGKGKMILPKEPVVNNQKFTAGQLSLFEAERIKQQIETESRQTAIPETEPQKHEGGKVIQEEIKEAVPKNENIPVLPKPSSEATIKRITVYYNDRSFQDFYPEA